MVDGRAIRANSLVRMRYPSTSRVVGNEEPGAVCVELLANLCPFYEGTDQAHKRGGTQLGQCGRLAHAGVRDLLAKYPSHAALKTAGRAKVARGLRDRSLRLADKVANDVMAALGTQSLTMPAEATIGRVISELASELDRLYARRDPLVAEVEEVFLAHPFGELLSTLPGIGPRTGQGSLLKWATAAASSTATSLPPTPAWRP